MKRKVSSSAKTWVRWPLQKRDLGRLPREWPLQREKPTPKQPKAREAQERSRPTVP